MNFEEVDEVLMGNGFNNNQHCIQLLPNGHYFLVCYDKIRADLTEYGGYPDAYLLTPVLQELDAEKNVVWQWRFLDFFEPDDGPFSLDKITNEIIHLNSIDFDHDGHILISNIRMENCMKINRQTGEVMWILGGPLNDFTFIGCDPDEAVGWFDGHDFRRLENGNVLFFDNSDNYSNYPSHVIEFKLDEDNLIAELVLEYIREPILRGATRGNAQRLSNGNTMVGWGNASAYGGAVCTEINAEGETLMELHWAHRGLSSYRAFRYPVDYYPAADIAVEDVARGGEYDFQEGGVTCGISVEIEEMEGLAGNELRIRSYGWAPIDPIFAGHDPLVYKSRVVMSYDSIETIAGEIFFDVEVFGISNPDEITIYQRASEGGGGFFALNTVYDHVGDVVRADFVGGGEFIITYPDLAPVPFAPKAIAPEEGELVNEEFFVDLQWSPRGFITVFDLQVATDSEFTNVVADESGLTSTTYRFMDVSAATDYYWRVRAYNAGGVSDWSQVASFSAAAPYVEVTTPDGSDKWKRGLDYVIAWEDNLYEEVVIELFKDGEYLMEIDTTESDGGYEWEVDLGLQRGCDYSIRIKSALDEAVSAMSDPFRINRQRGDFDCDGCVGFDDLQVLAGEWLNEQSGLGADADDDGRVDVNDLAVLAQGWMKGCQ